MGWIYIPPNPNTHPGFRELKGKGGKKIERAQEIDDFKEAVFY